jgi:DNA gyrase/topoisomerase IV subunit A
VIAMDVVAIEPVMSGDQRKRVVEPDLMVVLENGLGKRTPVSNFRDQSRGGVGIKAAKVTDKTGKVVEAAISYGDNGDIIIVSHQGQVIRLPLKSVKRIGRDTQGVTLMRLPAGDRVASASVVQKGTEAEEDGMVDPIVQGLPPELASKVLEAELPPEKPAD